MVARVAKLRREVLAPVGPSRRQAVAVYRRRRKAVERGRRFMQKVQTLVDAGLDTDAADVVDELWLLIKELENTL